MNNVSLESAITQTFTGQLILDDQFRITEYIKDAGGQSFIFLAFSTVSSEKFYFKVIDPSISKTRIQHELQMANEITRLQVPFLVPCVATLPVFIPFCQSQLETVALIMPAFLTGDLFNYVLESHPSHHPLRCGLDEFEIRILGRDMVEALIILHDHHFVHNDVKPENFLLTPREGHELVALCDYGMVMQLDENGFAHRNLFTTGTSGYRAPELINRNESWTAAVDLWALGCTFFLMFCGENAFLEDETWKFRILCGEPNPVITQLNPSAEFLDLVEKLICINPEERLTAKEVAQHPFFRETGDIKETVNSVLPDDTDASSGSL
jgi:serine/threonine protein kinase